MPPVLKAALRDVPLEAPFRGPKFYKFSGYQYENEYQGDLSSFHGTEIIHVNEQIIYRLNYAGGMVE